MNKKPCLFSNNSCNDFVELQQLVRDFYVGLGEANDVTPVSLQRAETVVHYLYADIGHYGGIDKAGVFKQAAVVTSVFNEVTPVELPIPDKFFERFKKTTANQVEHIRQHTNTIIAFELCRELLHNARIEHPDEKIPAKKVEKCLTKRIEVSEHTWCDIIRALSTVKNVSQTEAVALLYELLAYQVNPDCSYNSKI